MQLTKDQVETIGKLADRCDNLVAATYLGIAAAQHVDLLRKSLDTMAQEIRAWYVEVTGENPWHTGEAPR